MKGEVAASAQDLGLAMAYLRDARTQAQVAREAGLSRAAWSLYEAGRRRPTPANLNKILRGLGCSQEELEELAWQFRRRRLNAQRDGQAMRSRRPRHRTTQELRRWGPAEVSGRLADPELVAILTRLSSVLEELILSVLRYSR